ncbi:MAG: MFS transporter [Selenomonas sp.]|uniref:MFS transporter n=1 Tax=Selenomonas sp. TaxID=2053611 RepID=UPI0025FD211A|nr:MFS transporter [Selenomonas sp.]MCI6086810.1 MFS transporter [Selenomonas sp.]MDY4416775.1 MFS transporter [Selenomonas sp.]
MAGKNASRKTPGVREQWAVRALFFVGGFGSASWAPLVPYLKARLAIEDDVLGMLLLCVGIGSLVTMPVSGTAAERFGCRRVLLTAGTLFAMMLLGLSVVDVLPLAVVLLLLFGASMGAIDTVVNIAAVLVEQASGRRLMSGFHGFWSVGGFVGAGLFGLWVGTVGLTPLASTVIAAAIIAAVMLVARSGLLPYGGGGGGALIAIPRGIVAFIGAIACIAFLVEGAVMDWGGVFLTTVRGMDMAMAGTGFAIFSAAMLVMRLTGDAIVSRLGQRAVVLGGTLTTMLGFLGVIYLPGAAMYLGFFAIGVGAANVVPVFYSLLGRQDVMPLSTAVPAVSTLGYLGVLMGPAAIGFLAHAIGIADAFLFLALLVAVEMGIAAYVFRSVKA